MAQIMMPPSTQQQSVPVELDLNDVKVPLTKARALGLQAELYARFSSLGFQAKLNELRHKHIENSPEFRKERLQLVLRAQAEVLPKYGFEATPQGVALMRTAVRELDGDPEVLSNTEIIDHLLGDGDAAWMVAHGPEVSHLEELSHTIAPEPEDEASAAMQRFAELTAKAAAAAAAAAGDASRAIGAEPRAAEREVAAAVAHGLEGGNIGVELDLDDVEVPLTRDRALALQEELLQAFGRRDFQDRLHDLEASSALQAAAEPPPGAGAGAGAGGGGASASAFRRARQALALEEQAKILPKYGYPPTLEGVARMFKEIHDGFPDDQQVQGHIVAIDRLLASSASAAPSPRRQRSGSPPQPASPSAGAGAGAAERASPRRRVRTVSASDGYWVVVGGRKHRGLLVRLGEDTSSHAWPESLENGAVVKQVQRVGERLHYEKISGNGPNYGWVSIHAKDHVLLKPFSGEVPLFKT